MVASAAGKQKKDCNSILESNFEHSTTKISQCRMYPLNYVIHIKLCTTNCVHRRESQFLITVYTSRTEKFSKYGINSCTLYYEL